MRLPSLRRVGRARRGRPAARGTALLAAALLLAARGSARAEAGAAEAAAPMTLDRAVGAGLLQVEGERAASFQSVVLVLTSQSKAPLTVDLTGRHLRPTTRGCQRLGLAFPVETPRPKDAPPGTFPLTLSPGERRELRMNSCCLDIGKPCPGEKDRFVLDLKPTPPAAEVALRWWVEHPTAPQGFVNAAIWQRNPGLLEGGPGTDNVTAFRSQVRSHRGVLYVVEDGVLTSIDREGVRRFHATRVLDARPGDTGLLAVALGASGLELWRFGETGDPPWVRVLTLDAPVDQWMEGPGGTFLLRRKHELRFLADRTREPVVVAVEGRADVEVAGARVARVGAAGAGALFVHRKGQGPAGAFNAAQGVHERAPTVEWHDLDLRRGTTKHRRTFWHVADLDGGPGGVFAVSRSGRLLRAEGTRLVPVPTEGDWVRLAAVGLRRLVVESAGGRLVAVDARTGREALLPADAADVSIDPVTDDVVWLAAAAVQRFTGGATVEAVPLR